MANNGIAAAVIFAVVALAVAVGVPYYVWRRLVRDTTVSRRARRIGTWLIVGATVLLLATFASFRVLPHTAAAVLSWPAYLWLAVMFYLMVCLIVLEVPAFVARRLALRRVPAVEQPSRRVFLARTVAVAAGVASVGIVGSGVRNALGPPQIKRIQIPLAKLPRSADGLRIALVSDIHLGPLTGIGHTTRIVSLVNSTSPDLIAIVGDLVDGTVEELGPLAVPLRSLESRLGAFFVTGNHEYFSGFEPWLEEVSSLGLKPLRNERVELPGIDLAGVNDPTGEAYGDPTDVGLALADRDPARPVVLLAHQPIVAHDAASYSVDLQLSGHTHGGQMVPFNWMVRLAQQPVVSGLGTVDGMPVYVTNGAGYWGPPVRVGAPSDITVVELRSR